MSASSTYIEQVCEYDSCSKVFQRSMYDVNRGFRRFCSVQCGSANRRKYKVCASSTCKEQVKAYEGRRGAYHSRECALVEIANRSRNTVDVIYELAGGYHGMAGPSARIHPSALPNGSVRVHVMVAYDKYGPGPHECHWCGCTVDWMFGEWAGPGADVRKIAVDHVDVNPSNDDPTNLVVSCGSCNTKRLR